MTRKPEPQFCKFADNESVKQITRSVLLDRGEEGVSTEEIARILSSYEEALLMWALWKMVKKGQATVSFPEGDDNPTFRLAKKGDQDEPEH